MGVGVSGPWNLVPVLGYGLHGVDEMNWIHSGEPDPVYDDYDDGERMEDHPYSHGWFMCSVHQGKGGEETPQLR